MNEKTVLVIDDSATIRRFVDSELSSAGYRVISAATAEDGIAKARNEKPDLIILDHQLPGTTGYEVCLKLLETPEVAQIPVVASSTLRKKAYAEYVDCDNVVDMLPKPYKPDVLIATVENSIDTAELVVQSQNQGSAVPEVIDELGESELAGTFACFGLREVLDLLNNGTKQGVLEVETPECRIFVFVDNGRIQAVTGSGVNLADIARYMPESLSELTPVLKFTLAGRRGAEVDGLVDLLDNKVLDPRLLRRLLRLQAAMLLRICFTSSLKSFRFDTGRKAPALYRKLPLDCSLLALLVDGAMTCEMDELPALESTDGFVRRAIRGQNLDRAGISSRHMKLMSSLSEAITPSQICEKLDWSKEEIIRVLHGFELAELVERQTVHRNTKVAVVSTDDNLNHRLAACFDSNREKCSGKLVKDWLAASLLLRRYQPEILLVELLDLSVCHHLDSLQNDGLLENVRVIGICSSEANEAMDAADLGAFDQVLDRECTDEELLAAFSVSPSRSCDQTESELPTTVLAASETPAMHSEV